MTRRTIRCFITLALGLLVAPLAAEAQSAGKVAQIGYLSPGTVTASAGGRQAFTEGLRHHGWIEGQNLAIAYRWAAWRYERLPGLAADLARLPLDAIFAVNTPTALALQRTGTTRPVVFAIVSEPVEIELVASLPQPGRNFTGLTTINRELMAKRLEVLKETIPTLTRVGYLANPDYVAHAAQHAEMEAAAHRLGLTLQLAEARACRGRGGVCPPGGRARRRRHRAAGRALRRQPGAGHQARDPASPAGHVCGQLLSAVRRVHVLRRQD
jgi:putative tryptophan/tyrosine transport system substrate-binding protein